MFVLRVSFACSVLYVLFEFGVYCFVLVVVDGVVCCVVFVCVDELLYVWCVLYVL